MSLHVVHGVSQEEKNKDRTMVFGSIVPSHLSALSLQEALELCHVYLENAYKTKNRNTALVLCHDAEVVLSQAKTANKKHPAQFKNVDYQALRKEVAASYIDLGKILEIHGYQDEAKTIYKKSEKWG